jgi:DNA repair protein RadC
MNRMSAKPLDEIRSADQSVEEIARHALDSEPQRDAQADEVLHCFDMSVAGGLSEPVAVPFEHQPEVLHIRPLWNPLVVLAEADHNVLTGVEVLEALIYLGDPEAKCRQIAVKALQVFGSVGAVLSAGVPDLTIKLGIRQEIAYALKAIHTGMRSVLKEPIRERISIGSFADLIEYLEVNLKYEMVEVMRVLYLDRKNGLIFDEETNRGTVDHVPIYPREIVKRALELGASAVIMVHNHPSGDPTPSKADVIFSQQVERALSVMNITLHDSLIVGKNGFASLRSLGRLDTEKH